ncbi:MAG: hypothetical protein AMXMBFR64_61090 [Myxococcales bacterium]
MLLLVALALAACHGHDHPLEPEEAAEELPSSAVTLFAAHTELFVEFPALVVGEDAPFAAHLTRLADFKPVEAGRVVAELSGGAPDERFEVDGPSVPGIFRPVVRPIHAGPRRLRVRLIAGDLSDEHDLGEMTVHADRAAIADAPADEEPGLITFLKEQSWRLDFATAPVAAHTLRPSLAVWSSVRVRAGGNVRVGAPVAGRVEVAEDVAVGRAVAAGAVLARIAPRLPDGGDAASLDLGVETARIQLAQARRERERLDGLLTLGIVAARSVDEARSAEKQAAAHLRAATRRRAQGAAIQGAHAEATIEVRAPFDGLVTSVEVAPGAWAAEGDALFQLLDVTNLWLEARVPEADLARVLNAPGDVWFEVEGRPTPLELPAEALVSRGVQVDPVSRTAGLVWALPGAPALPGTSARAHVVTGPAVTALAVPREALVHEGGQPVVYVQVGGESFARRPVEPGIRDRGLVEIRSGLTAGERVVTRGAYAVRLAASAGSVPAHGHAH